LDTRKALAFIREHGDALAHARAMALLEGTPPTPEVVAGLERGASPGGGWPAGLEVGSPGGIGATVEVLFSLADLGLEEHPLAQKGLAFLLARQEPDGAWQEPPAERASPLRWLRQGEEAGRLYLTAWVGSLLVAYGREEDPAVTRALDLLLKCQLPGGAFTGFPRHTTWYALPLLARRLGIRSGPTQNILLFLGQELGEKGWFASMFAAMLHNLLLSGYGMETALVRTSWEQLLLRQGEDGSWASEEGEADGVRTTLEVLWCWKRIIQPA